MPVVKLAAPHAVPESADDLRDRVRRLSFDDAFGMLTRPALLDHATRLPEGTYFVLLIDLDGLHAINQRMGYEEVNRRVRNAFVPALRHTDLVGRWFSGDEILIVIPHDSRMLCGLVARLSTEADLCQLSFTYTFSRWLHPRQSLPEVATRSSSRLLARKKRKSIPRI